MAPAGHSCKVHPHPHAPSTQLSLMAADRSRLLRSAALGHQPTAQGIPVGQEPAAHSSLSRETEWKQPHHGFSAGTPYTVQAHCRATRQRAKESLELSHRSVAPQAGGQHPESPQLRARRPTGKGAKSDWSGGRTTVCVWPMKKDRARHTHGMDCLRWLRYTA